MANILASLLQKYLAEKQEPQNPLAVLPDVGDPTTFSTGPTEDTAPNAQVSAPVVPKQDTPPPLPPQEQIDAEAPPTSAIASVIPGALSDTVTQVSQEAKKGSYGAAAASANLLRGIAKIIPTLPIAASAKVKSDVLDYLKEDADQANKEAVKATPKNENIPEKLVGSGIETALRLPEYGLEGLAGPEGFAAGSAAQAYGQDQKLPQVLSAAGQGGTVGTIFHGSQDLAMLPRILTQAAGLGGLSALENPRDSKEAASSAIQGAIMGALGPTEGKSFPEVLAEAKDSLPTKLTEERGSFSNKPLDKSIWQMNPDELLKKGSSVKKEYEQKLQDILGGEDEVKRFNSLNRQANNTWDTDRADKAQEELKKIESTLTPEQQKIIGGVGENLTEDDYFEHQNALSKLDFTSPEKLGQSLKLALTDVGEETDPNKMTSRQLVAYHQLMYAHAEAENLGWSTRDVLNSGLKAASGRFKDPADAEVMLRRYLSFDPTRQSNSQLSVETAQNKLGPGVGEAKFLLRRLTEPKEELPPVSSYENISEDKKYPSKESRIPLPQIQQSINTEETEPIKTAQDKYEAVKVATGALDAWRQNRLEQLQTGENAVSDEDAQKLVRKEFPDVYKRTLMSMGVEPQFAGKTGSGWADELYRWNRVQSETGEPTGELNLRLGEAEYKRTHLQKFVRDSIDNSTPLKKIRSAGISDEDAFYLMHYVRTQPDGTVKFDPSPLKIEGKVDIGPFDTSSTSEKALTKALPYLVKLRENLDTLHSLANEGKTEKVGYLPGYVSYTSKLPQGGSAGNFESSAKPSIYQGRSSGETGKDLETNLGKVLGRYERQFIREKSFGGLSDNVAQQITRLRARGMNDLADKFEGMAGRSMGIPTTGGRKIELKYLLDKSQPMIDDIAEQTGSSPAITRQLYDSFSRLAYKAMVEMNIKNRISHTFQPEFVGSLDTGLFRVLQGRASAMFDPDTKNALDSVKERLRPARFEPENLQTESTPNKVIKSAEKFLGIPAIPGNAWMRLTDLWNRQTMFAAGYKRFKANPESALNKLQLETDRQNVKNSMQTAGIDAAAKEYGLVTARQAIDPSTKANLPEKLSQGLTPSLLSYSRARANREVEFLRQKKYGKVALRGTRSILNSLAVLFAGYMAKEAGNKEAGAYLAKLAGYTNPFGSAVGVLAPTIAPIITGPTTAIKKAVHESSSVPGAIVNGTGAALKYGSSMQPWAKMIKTMFPEKKSPWDEPDEKEEDDK